MPQAATPSPVAAPAQDRRARRLARRAPAPQAAPVPAGAQAAEPAAVALPDNLPSLDDVSFQSLAQSVMADLASHPPEKIRALEAEWDRRGLGSPP